MANYQDPKFDKKQYWYRRNKGWRGQFDALVAIRHHFSPPQVEKPLGAKAIRKNTKRARKELQYASN